MKRFWKPSWQREESWKPCDGRPHAGEEAPREKHRIAVGITMRAGSDPQKLKGLAQSIQGENGEVRKSYSVFWFFTDC